MQLTKQAERYDCGQNLILHILTKFHDDDVIHTKIMDILSTSTSEIFNVFYRNLQKKETAVILKRTDQFPQNLARVHNLVESFPQKSLKFQIFLFFLLFPFFSIVCLLSAFCSKFDTLVEVQNVH